MYINSNHPPAPLSTPPPLTCWVTNGLHGVPKDSSPLHQSFPKTSLYQQFLIPHICILQKDI